MLTRVRVLCALALASLPYGPAQARPVAVTFYAPDASSVSVSGSFDPFWSKLYPMKKDARGRWSIVLDVAPGRYEIQFLVDGQWHHHPGMAVIGDAFGGLNNVLLVHPAIDE